MLMIGLPGSGKSFLAANLQQKQPQSLIISTDAIRAELFGDEAIQGDWFGIWRRVEEQFRQAAQQIQSGQLKLSIYDATNARRRYRRDAIALARASGFTHLTGLWLDTPLPLCLARNQGRSRQVPEAIIRQMHRQLLGAPPHRSEGLDDLVRLPKPASPCTGIAPFPPPQPNPLDLQHLIG